MLVFVYLGLAIFCCFFPLMLRYGGCLCGFFGCFFSPSLVGESSLSLLLFKFMDISMGSMFWLSSFVVNDCFAVDCLAPAVAAVAGFAVAAKRAAASVVAGSLGGAPFPPSPLATCVHPSSLSPGAPCWFSEASAGTTAAMTGEGAAAAAAVLVVVVVIAGF